MSLESFFSQFRPHIIGQDASIATPHGNKRVVYADWTASGRLYRPIEHTVAERIGAYVANTHTETSATGALMTHLYHEALKTIKEHVGASDDDAIISSNSGMTGVVNKLQRILGLRVHERWMDALPLPKEERPIVLVTHMEHHSNQTSWLETVADVEIIPPTAEGLVDLAAVQPILDKYADRPVKIAAITSCSNVTGIATPYHEIAEIMHRNGGLCFVDFACSAPYIDICMRPENPERKLDAIYFSPHKFLGGPGTTGILLFDKKLYSNKIPDNPGGGTVDWTNPWGEHKYVDDIEAREDGGTPAFLPTMKVALCVRLKEQMGTRRMAEREHEQMSILWDILQDVHNLHILAHQHKDRLGILSFWIEGLHYNLAVRMLNDRFGIQARGGCSCAGTYGHYLLNVSREHSRSITERINHGDLSDKPGWVRVSIHPTMSNEEVLFIAESIRSVARRHQEWSSEYTYLPSKNDYCHLQSTAPDAQELHSLFAMPIA